MAGHKRWGERRRAPRSPEARREGDEFERAMRDALALGELRETFELTQVELASRLGTTQSGLSRLERREDLYLSTLRDYVAALGGDLVLSARFPGGQEIRLDPGAPD